MVDSTWSIWKRCEQHSCCSGLDGCSKLDKWSHVPKNIFAPFGDKYLCFFSNLKSAFKGLQMITSHFWNAVLKTWLDLNYHDPSMHVPILLWNSHTKYQGNVLMFTDCVNGRWWQLQVGSKEQQTSHTQRFLILFLLFFWMVHTRGLCYSLSPSLALTYKWRLIVTCKSQHVTHT